MAVVWPPNQHSGPTSRGRRARVCFKIVCAQLLSPPAPGPLDRRRATLSHFAMSHSRRPGIVPFSGRQDHFTLQKIRRSSRAFPCLPGGPVEHTRHVRASPHSRWGMKATCNRDEALKRQTWLRYRSWSRITSGVLLSVIGAVQYGTAKVFYKIVPTL